MFSFLGTIFGKMASVITSVFIAVGLVSAPASVAPQPVPQEPQIQTTELQTQAQIEEQKPADIEVDVKAELEKLKNQLAEEQKKRKDLEKKVVIPAPVPKPAPSPTPVVITPPPAPIVVVPPPAPSPVTPPVQLLPGQFILPSGAIVDSTGKVVKEAPIPTTSPSTASPSNTSGQATTTPATPPPAPIWPPASGSTVNIQRSILSVINFNSQLTCDQLLALPPSKKDLCKLYKENEGNNKYIWHIIEDL